MDITQVVILAVSGGLAGVIARLVIPGSTRKRQALSLLLFVALFASIYLLSTQVVAPLLRAKVAWQTFSSQGGGFSVLLPQTPTDAVQNIATDAGAVPMHSFSIQNLGAQYTVAYVDYPASVVSAQAPEKLLAGARDGSVNALQNAALKYSRAITLTGAYPGLEYQVNLSNQAMLARIYLVQNRLYETVVVAPAQNTTPEDATMFLDSFQVLK